MRKLLIGLFTFLALLLLVNPYGVFAQEPVEESVESAPDASVKMINPIYPGSGVTEPFLGQSHSYSYVFRGNGEAVVTTKVVLANTSESEVLREATLRFPDIEPKELAVYQIIGNGQCIRYDTPGYDSGYGGFRPPTCLEYGEPDYYGYYGTAKYQKAEFEYTGDTLTVKLPRTIAPQKSGAFFVYFRAFGIAKKGVFGSFKYEIETLKVDDQINQLTIGINTDNDLFLKGAKGEVDYRFAESDVAALKAAPMGGTDAVASPAIDRFLGNVGYGVITKSASNLAPLESYKVRGQYAKTKMGLYAKETTIVLGVLVFLLFVSVIIVRKVLKSFSGGVKKVISKTEESRKEDAQVQNPASVFFAGLGISFLASVMIGLYTGTVLLAGSYLNNISYQYQSFIALFMVVISFCIYSFLLFAPGVLWGIKKGIGWGIGVIVMTIFWLFIFFMITLAVLFFFGNGGGGVYPMPLTKYAE